MKISRLTYATKVGHFIMNEKPHVKTNLTFIKDPNLSREDYKKNHARVYFITLDGEIVKIGGSNAKGGICGTITPYCSGNGGRPSDRTFGVNYLIHEHLSTGATVEFYAQWASSAKVIIQALTAQKRMEVEISYKALEEACVKEYLKLNNGEFPRWNYQEAHLPWPNHIREARYQLLEGK